MKRLTTDTPDGNFETSLNFVYGKDEWAYIRHDGEHEDVMLIDWAKRQCLLRGCDEVLAETTEKIDQQLCDCMMESPICPIALAYCFASQAVHLRSRLKMYENTIPLERAQELAQAEKDGRLVVLQNGVTVRYLQEEYRKAKRTADGRLPSPDYTTGRISGFCAGVVHVLDKILTREEAEAALKKREATE